MYKSIFLDLINNTFKNENKREENGKKIKPIHLQEYVYRSLLVHHYALYKRISNSECVTLHKSIYRLSRKTTQEALEEC